MTDSGGIRLNKFISETGICSRREADRLVEEGRVQVNGRTAEMGMRVGPDDRIVVNGKSLRAKPRPVYIVYNKPVGITCTTDSAVPENIVSAVRYPGGRIFPIGRLDKPSEGLILLTNDGDIVNKILRAGNAHEKEYLVSVDRPVNQEFLRQMAAGVPILGTVTRPCKIRQVSPDTFNITLTQGLNRQIRRMSEYLGYNVTRLKRLRVMNIGLGKLKAGQWRELSAAEIAAIEAMIAGSSKTEEASVPAQAPGVKSRSKSASKPGTANKAQTRSGARPRSGTAKGQPPKSGKGSGRARAGKDRAVSGRGSSRKGGPRR